MWSSIDRDTTRYMYTSGTNYLADTNPRLNGKLREDTRYNGHGNGELVTIVVPSLAGKRDFESFEGREEIHRCAQVFGTPSVASPTRTSRLNLRSDVINDGTCVQWLTRRSSFIILSRWSGFRDVSGRVYTFQGFSFSPPFLYRPSLSFMMVVEGWATPPGRLPRCCGEPWGFEIVYGAYGVSGRQ